MTSAGPADRGSPQSQRRNISLNRSIPTEHLLGSELAWSEEVVVAMQRTHPLAAPQAHRPPATLPSEDQIVLQPESSKLRATSRNAVSTPASCRRFPSKSSMHSRSPA
jgi:hypothetical protein